MTEITIPSKTVINYMAFNRCNKLIKINITKEQFANMAKGLHEDLIGVATNFVVNINLDKDIVTPNGEFSFLEEITLNTNIFNFDTLYLLYKLVYHHYQIVAVSGIGEESYETLPIENRPTEQELIYWLPNTDNKWGAKFYSDCDKNISLMLYGKYPRPQQY